MKYISTRGGKEKLDFESVVLNGLAKDGGLYMPEELPVFSKETIASWRGLSYQELALKVIQPFVGDCLTTKELQGLIDDSYAEFDHPDVIPLIDFGLYKDAHP